MTYLYEDDFSRVVAEGLGRTDDYDPGGADVTDVSVDGDTVVIIPNRSNGWEWTGAPTTHGYYYFDFYVPSDVNDYHYWEIDTRVIDGLATYFYVYATGEGVYEVGTDAASSPDWFEFTPTSDTWYRLAAHLDTGAEMVRMKVWPRDEPQPATWTIDLPAETGIGGSWDPWLYLDSGDEPLLFDNLVVSDEPIYLPNTFSIAAVVDGDIITGSMGVSFSVARGATRFYPATHIPSLIDFDPDAAWVNAPGWILHERMFPWRSAEFLETKSRTETSTSVHNGLLAQFVSPPLAAQTITGTVAAVFMARESSGTADMQSQFVARVIAPDGTVRGTLVAADTASLTSEWLVNTSTYRTARFPVASNGTSVSSVAALDGDRIVVEIGYRALNITASGMTGVIRAGGNPALSSGGDHPQNDTTSANQNDYPWIEFSQVLTFLETPTPFSDSIAGAPEVMPDPLSDIVIRGDPFDIYTSEGDDPTELMAAAGQDISGWVKVTATDTPAILDLYPMSGYWTYPVIGIYDEVPTAASVSPYDLLYHDFFDSARIVVPAGETYYLGIVVEVSAFVSTPVEVGLLIHRVDAGTPTGDIKDTIADAVDGFPPALDTELDSETTNLTAFTTEADDPTEVATITGHPLGYTGWLKLVLTEDADVSISLIEDETLDNAVLTLWLYDEVPTSSSVAIYSDTTFPASFGDLPLTTGTYYLLVTPYIGADWDLTEYDNNVGRVTVRVRWEFPATVSDFDAEAIVLRTQGPPTYKPDSTPVLIDTVTGTVEDDAVLSLTIPVTAQHNDILVFISSHDLQGNSQAFNVLSLPGGYGTNIYSNNTVVSLLNSETPSNGHGLRIAYTRWNGQGDAFVVTIRDFNVGDFPTAIAGALLVYRDADPPVLRSSVNSGTLDNSVKPTAQAPWGVSVSDANYGAPITMIGVWASSYMAAGATPTTWTPVSPVSELLDIGVVNPSFTDNKAGLMVGTWTDVLDTSVSARLANPSLVETTFTAAVQILPLSISFPLYAWVQPGWQFDAVIGAVPVRTTHLRTGPHTGTHPSTAIVTSALLGSLAAGTDLDTVIADIDQRLTDLETQN